MADGSRKKIEHLRAGEYVLAKDPVTGRSGARKVTEVRSKVSVRTMVELTDSSGGKIKATDEHPFWVESEKRWVKAVDLKPSYRFLTADNRSAEVTGTRSWSGIQKVHNFTVDGLHTYYVASSKEAAPLLVHNDDEKNAADCGERLVEEAVSRSADGTKHGNSFVAESALRGATGKTTAAGNRAIDAIIAEDFPNLRFTHKPASSPWASTGIASRGEGTQIGYKSMESREDLRNVLVHEELHHRWWDRGITESHHPRDGSGLSSRFYGTIERYERMRGWRK